MNLKKVILILASIIVVVYLYLTRYDVYSIYELRNCIVWSNDVKIEFNDYEMEPDINSEIGLNFWHGIYLKSNGFGDAKAIAIFDKSKSWSKDTLTFDYQEELKLQKLSFDLAEVYARKMNDKIKALKYANYDKGIPYKKLESNCKLIYDEFANKNDLMINDDGKSIAEIIIYWRPKVDEMLIKQPR